jgi:hypothetical protein
MQAVHASSEGLLEHMPQVGRDDARGFAERVGAPV